MTDKKTFTWDVAYKPRGKTKYETRVVKFGDGYEQRQQIGLAAPLNTWDASLKAELNVIQDVKEFLDEHRGVHSFRWQNPLGKSVLVVADELETEHIEGDYWQVRCSFREVRA